MRVWPHDFDPKAMHERWRAERLAMAALDAASVRAYDTANRRPDDPLRALIDPAYVAALPTGRPR